MKHLYKNVFRIFSLFFFFNSPASFAYNFESSNAQQFADEITQSLAQLYQGDLSFDSAKISNLFLKLPRSHEENISDLVENQYRLLHFHDQILKAATKYNWIYTEKYLAIIQHLINSKVYVSPENFKKILNNRPQKRISPEEQTQIYFRLRRLIEIQGNPALYVLAKNAGLKIPLNPQFYGESSDEVDEEDIELGLVDEELELNDGNRQRHWYENFADRDHYQIDLKQWGVWYRNTFFRTGDILGVRLEVADDGLFSSFSFPQKYLGHAGIFILMKYKNRYIPVVLETMGNGIVAVPLRYFLSPKKTRYVEIFRKKSGLSVEQMQKFSSISLKSINEPRGYNLLGPSGYPNYLTCIEVPKFIYEQVGLKILKEKSRWATNILEENFKSLGLIVNQFLTPTQLLSEEDFVSVDFIDNGQFTKLVQSHLITDKLGEIAGTQKLLPPINYSSYPISSILVNLQTFFINQAKFGVPVFSSLLLFFSDLEDGNFPGGNAYFLTFISSLSQVSEDVGLNAERDLYPILESKMDQRQFSFADIKNDPRINQIVESLTDSFQEGFEKLPAHLIIINSRTRL